MGKKTLFCNITPLPSSVTREVAIAMLHNHGEMIELNPMVIEHHPIKTPRDAPADEFLDCAWEELTDKVHYLPGGLVKGKVTYKACFHDLPNGLQTHVYAPTGLNIREKWTIAGTLPGEPPEKRELGSTAPAVGLYLKEECEMRCNRLLNSFVRKNLDEAHRVLVERIMKKAELIERRRNTISRGNTSVQSGFSQNPLEQAYVNGFQIGGHMSQSKILQSPTLVSPQTISPQSNNVPSPIDQNQQHIPPNLADHPAFRNDRQQQQQQQIPPTHNLISQAHNRSWSTNNTTTTTTGTSDMTAPTPGSSLTGASNPTSSRPQHYQHASMSAVTPFTSSSAKHFFVAELPGSVPIPVEREPQMQFRRHSLLSDMSSDVAPGGTDRGSVVSALDLGSSVILGPALAGGINGGGGGMGMVNGEQQLPQTRYQYNPVDFERR